MEKKLLTVQEASEFLNCHTQTVRKLIREREIPFVKKKGLGYRLKPDDLEKWLDSNSHLPEGWNTN